MKRDAPATHRNREPILEILERWLAPSARVLEVASGSGQHAVFFAERLPTLDWQPSDADAESLDSIAAWIADTPASGVRPPLRLDASEDPWPIEPGSFDAVFNANMIHISPWEVGQGLLRGAGRALVPAGLLFLYGPFRVGGAHTSASNASFDAGLRERDPRWGVRDLEDVVATAEAHGLERVETNEMPANNKLVVFRRRPERT